MGNICFMNPRKNLYKVPFLKVYLNLNACKIRAVAGQCNSPE